MPSPTGVLWYLSEFSFCQNKEMWAGGMGCLGWWWGWRFQAYTPVHPHWSSSQGFLPCTAWVKNKFLTRPKLPWVLVLVPVGWWKMYTPNQRENNEESLFRKYHPPKTLFRRQLCLWGGSRVDCPLPLCTGLQAPAPSPQIHGIPLPQKWYFGVTR
jgi:hypothetical protein